MGDFNDVRQYTNDVLMHHGIKGQKWGVRNGPPYPLKAGAKSKAEKGEQTGVILEAAMATVALAAITCAVVSEVKENQKFKKALKLSNSDKYADEREGEEIDPKTGLYLKKNKNMTPEEDMERINPNYEEGQPFQTNCTFCTAAMELRMRGYDVHAGKITEKHRYGLYTEEHGAFFGKDDEKTKYTEFEDNSLWTGKGDNEKYKSDLKNYLVEQGDGARGELCVSWLGGGGHSMYYTVKGKELTVWDTQANEKLKGSDLDTLLDSTDGACCKRLDDKQVNMDALNKWKAVC